MPVVRPKQVPAWPQHTIGAIEEPLHAAATVRRFHVDHGVKALVGKWQRLGVSMTVPAGNRRTFDRRELVTVLHSGCSSFNTCVTEGGTHGQSASKETDGEETGKEAGSEEAGFQERQIGLSISAK